MKKKQKRQRLEGQTRDHKKQDGEQMSEEGRRGRMIQNRRKEPLKEEEEEERKAGC